MRRVMYKILVENKHELSWTKQLPSIIKKLGVVNHKKLAL